MPNDDAAMRSQEEAKINPDWHAPGYRSCASAGGVNECDRPPMRVWSVPIVVRFLLHVEARTERGAKDAANRERAFVAWALDPINAHDLSFDIEEDPEIVKP